LFSSLLENAVSHNDPSGLTVRVEATQRDEFIDVVVSDDGTGIPDTVRGECFEMGAQGHESDGDGLGLYLVSRLGDVYGGDVEVTDGTGGATFRVTLPAAPARNPTASDLAECTGQGLRKTLARR